MATNDLPDTEIKRLVYAYEDPQITDELYRFGKMLLTEIDDRVKHIDSKAGTVLAWSTAILAFLFTQITSGRGALNLSLGSLISVLALLAVISAYSTLRTRQEWLWPSDRDWFEATAFGSADA
ncbi:MAG: hypothetical protein DMG76_09880 [Acidobacteria bacterium]|nr:MAG: hypothetical protein DMG76_09880 [Acidobacteriota bacterium]